MREISNNSIEPGISDSGEKLQGDKALILQGIFFVHFSVSFILFSVGLLLNFGVN